ncbi:unnamed protein product [Rotaria sordida]|uniref:Uncharacterized protein n=1 Tax=Rotaria sordida TaxID=392033 RepID=A0A815GJ33_9BILA|nr:unnamed protein product [Rotaria sordida]CAF1596529.1 unnamed protein product [Rotaria sordida]
MAAANEELVQLVTNQARDLLAQIRKDIDETSNLTEDDRKNCEAICQRVENEHARLKIEFLRESLNLIDQALQTSDEQQLKQIHQAWSWTLDNVTRQCENFAGPLVEVLRILSRNNPEMETKYATFITDSFALKLITGTYTGATTGAGIDAVVGGPLGAAFGGIAGAAYGTAFGALWGAWPTNKD